MRNSTKSGGPPAADPKHSTAANISPTFFPPLDAHHLHTGILFWRPYRIHIANMPRMTDDYFLYLHLYN